MALLTINSTAVKTPSKFKVTLNDIDGETTRNANGEMMRDRIATKRKIEMEFPPLTQAQMYAIQNAIKDVFFQVTYLDPYGDPAVSNGMQTRWFYVGDRNAPMYKFGNGTTDVLWENVAFNIIEK